MKKLFLTILLSILLIFVIGCEGSSESKVIIKEKSKAENLFFGDINNERVIEFNIKDLKEVKLTAETWTKGNKIEGNIDIASFGLGDHKVLIHSESIKDGDKWTGLNWNAYQIEGEKDIKNLINKKIDLSKGDGIFGTSFEIGNRDGDKVVDLVPDGEFVIANFILETDGNGISPVGTGKIGRDNFNLEESTKDNDYVLVLKVVTGAKIENKTEEKKPE